ncbi:amphiphysin isoform X2 [Dermatophagoides pteronyssinus]|uniref:Histone deacetylase complex subunit SAP18 n=1 Tax=Dermatophagoides pteronyssinus TaxID=6956 RepID=A0ABQ8IQJ5_DERPT|nr:Histone deacetylase complex subunit SAP18 [Dermatophagoides pteronyssinus]
MVHNMADSKTSGFSKVVAKHSLRAKERFLQNFGKKDRTTDELFEIYQTNFNKQQTNATRLLKEMKNYATCAREMQSASKSLLDCMADIYENDWPGQESIPDRIKSIEMLWGDLCHKLNDQCTIPLSTYLSQFSEIRNKIDKRGRKLLDYDAARHNHETIQAASKKRDDMKLTKSREQMDESRRLYEVLNKELHEELPALYDSRIPFYINMFQTLFNSETQFHQEYSKVDHKLAEMIEQLAIEAAKGTFQSDAGHYLSQIQQQQQQQQQHSPTKVDKKSSSIDVDHQLNDDKQQLQQQMNSESESMDNMNMNKSMESDQESPIAPPHLLKTSLTKSSANKETNGDGDGQQHNGETNQSNGNCNDNDGMNHKKEELYEIPIGATTVDLPPGVLYKVKATYKYAAEDNDELTFESGEILHVIQYEDPEEQEEGWLMGIRELTGEKGLFPANFTRPI